MRKLAQVVAAAIVLFALSVWVATGAHRGWTQTSVPVKTLDEVTGLEAITYQDRFVPGVDFLGAAGAGASLLLGASFLFRRKTNLSKPVAT